jgi:hypothetical protein
MSTTPRKTWLPFAILAMGLIAWAGLFALGAYLEWGADKPRHDLRKPLIILAVMAVFLAFWGSALWRRSRRKSHMPEWNRNVDKRSVEAVEWSLWATMMCECDKCGTVLDLPHWSQPHWNDPIDWAKHWAPTVQEKGWAMAEDGFNLVCPNCYQLQRRAGAAI